MYLFKHKLNPFHGYREEDSGNGDNGTGGKDDGKGEGDTKPTIELLGKAVGMLAQQMDTITQGQTKLTEALEAIKAGAKPPEPDTKVTVPDPTKMFENVDLSNLDNAGLATLVIQKATELVEAKMKEVPAMVDGKVNPLAEAFHAKGVKEQVDALSKDNKDFFEWTKEIREVVGKHPTLGIPEAYALAKMSNPQKDAELKKKYAEPPKVKSFMGLTPTSGSHAENKGKMSPQQAALAAFDEVMGNLEHLTDNNRSII